MIGINVTGTSVYQWAGVSYRHKTK